MNNLEFKGTNLIFINLFDAPPNFLIVSIVSLKVKTTKREGVEAHSLARNILEIEGCVRALG